MGDRIAVLNNGIMQQCDTPLNLYNHPANMFVAGFIGSPAMNMIPVTVKPSGDGFVADAGSFQVELPASQNDKISKVVGKPCVFGIRPENIYDRNLEGLVKPTPGNTVKVGVDVIEPLGNDVEMYLTAGSHQLIAMIDNKTRARVGEELEVIFDMEKSHLFDKETEAAIY